MWNGGSTTARMPCASGATNWRAPLRPFRGVPQGRMVSLIPAQQFYGLTYDFDCSPCHWQLHAAGLVSVVYMAPVLCTVLSSYI